MNLLGRWQQRLAQSALGQRWQHFQPGERRALSGLGGVALVALLYLSIWQPVQRYLDQSTAWYSQQRELNEYLLANAEQARASPASFALPVSAVELRGLLTRTAQEQGLNIELFETSGTGAQVNLAPSAFDHVLRWLQHLQSQGVGFGEVSLQRGDQGLVQARLNLMASPQRP